MKENHHIPPIRYIDSLLIFAGAGLLLYGFTHLLIPYLGRKTGIEPVFFWFLCGGFGVFVPLLITAYLMLRREDVLRKSELWKDRLRFRDMTIVDSLWVIGSVVCIAIFSSAIIRGMEAYLGTADYQPSFMRFEPLTPGRYWLLLVWFPYWLLNIMGEEILWRGVLLPRQEARAGKFGWLLNGFGWMIFHLAFGWQLLLTLLPTLFILPYAVQKQKNSWVGVAIHAVVNGPAFMAIAFGWL